MLRNKIWIGLILAIILTIFSIPGFTAYYKYTQESGANFYVGTADKADALEDTNEMRQIIDDLGALLVHSKRNDLYPKDGTIGGTIQIPEAGLKFSNDPANNDIAAYIAGEMTWQTKAELGLDLSLYYLKTEIDTLSEVETIYTKDIIDSDELATLKFTDLADTPANYTGQAGKYIKVNAGETDLEFGIPTGAGTYLELTDTPAAYDNGKYAKSTVDGVIWDTPTGGYTNLTSFVDQTAWRVFYSNNLGDVIELALGTDGQYLKSTGATSAPIFDTPTGAGDMLKATYDSDEDGDIDVAAGGTEKSSWTLYAIPYLSGTTAFGEIPIGAAGQVLKVAAGATGYEFADESGGGYSNIVVCADYDHPDDAITAIGADLRTLLVTEAETCDTNFTVPANISVRFERGGKWTINNGITVTFNGQIDAGLWQIFEYTGTGTLAGNPVTREVFTTWWGGNVGIQINAAVTALGTNKGIITIPAGEYSFDTVITLSDNITLQGAGTLTTKLNWTGTNNTQDIITTNGNQLVLRDFAVFVGTGKSARSIIYIQNTRGSHFINLYLNGDSENNTTTLNGIYADGNVDNAVYYNLFENVFVGYCNENWHLIGSAVTQNTFTACRSSAAGLYGFYGTGHKFIMVGCTFEVNPIALYIFYGGAVVTGCYFESNTDTDIYIDHPDGMVVQGCRIKNSATKDYIIYCTGINADYKGIQIRDNIIKNTTGTVTTAIYLCSGAEASDNKFVVMSGVITNEYYAPAGSKVDGCECGEWAATLLCGTSGTITLSGTYNTGSYTKIGKMVTVTGMFLVDSVSSPVGTLTLNTLPFTVGNSNKFVSTATVYATGLENAAVTAIESRISKNTTSILISRFEAGNIVAMAGDVKASSQFIINATYFTD